ncbi:hypothetical protein D9611_009739 [Ephemerocybe angulata]|uniref:Uncharacterized protein n=1 Tax=Ephemerocybe angulata TaxID=980116 RepID=A0A8H5FGD8_9AGAR|nr:hypothetical protein D9611_009739 [Tulosesus angulatus]
MSRYYSLQISAVLTGHAYLELFVLQRTPPYLNLASLHRSQVPPYLLPSSTEFRLQMPGQVTMSVGPARDRHSSISPLSTLQRALETLATTPPNFSNHMIVSSQLTTIRDVCAEVWSRDGAHGLARASSMIMLHMHIVLEGIEQLLTAHISVSSSFITALATSTLTSILPLCAPTLSNGHGTSSLCLRTAFVVLQCWNHQGSIGGPVDGPQQAGSCVGMIRLMGVYLEQPGASIAIAGALQERHLLQELTIDSAACRLAQIPSRIRGGLTLDGAVGQILVIFGLLKALTRNVEAWAPIIRFKVVLLLFQALSYLSTSTRISDDAAIVAIPQIAHETFQWLKAKSVGIPKKMAQAVEGGALSIISATLGSPHGSPGTDCYDSVFNDLALVALHTCYPALLKPLKHALSTRSVSRDNGGERAQGLWTIIEANLARSLAHYERGVSAVVCDNLTHSEVSNDSIDPSGATKADWSLHRAECEDAKEIYLVT